MSLYAVLPLTEVPDEDENVSVVFFSSTKENFYFKNIKCTYLQRCPLN